MRWEAEEGKRGERKKEKLGKMFFKERKEETAQWFTMFIFSLDMDGRWRRSAKLRACKRYGCGTICHCQTCVRGQIKSEFMPAGCGGGEERGKCRREEEKEKDGETLNRAVRASLGFVPNRGIWRTWESHLLWINIGINNDQQSHCLLSQISVVFRRGKKSSACFFSFPLCWK